ncbi:MAG TPA: hypothetical protein VIL42_02660 [Sphingomicrobium sp.]|jgi:hypothetical protein
MKVITKFLAGGVAVAALASAAPAAAQYYPGYGYGYGSPYGSGAVVGAIINSVIGNGGYGYNGYAPYGYNVNSQAVVNQCANAVQARLGGGYNGYGAYGYNNSYAGGRVLGISRVENRSSGGLKVRGVATSGRNVAYGYNQSQVDLVWKCNTDYAGRIIDIDVDPVQSNYGYTFNTNNYTPWGTDYSQYGYRRY